jgi:hypothetical protein
MMMDAVVQRLAAQVLESPAEQAFAFLVEVGDLAIDAEGIHALADVVEDGAQPHLLPLRCGFEPLLCADVGANRDVFLGLAVLAEKRRDGGTHPVQRAILGPIADVAMPDMPLGDSAPHFPVIVGGMFARLQDAMVLAEQFFPRIAADFAEMVVGESDAAGDIGNADNGVMIERVLQAQGIARVAQMQRPQVQTEGQDHGGDDDRKQPGIKQDPGPFIDFRRQQALQQIHDQQFAAEDGRQHHREQP